MFKSIKYTFFLFFLCFKAVFPIDNTSQSLTIYTDYNSNILLPIFHTFEENTGTKIHLVYNSSIQRTHIIQGIPNNHTPDIVITKDAKSLALNADLLNKIPYGLIKKDSLHLTNEHKKLMRISYDTQVLAYSTERIKTSDLPKSALDLTNKKWKKKLSIAPNNISFQKFINTMQQTSTDSIVPNFIDSLIANETKKYQRDIDQIQAIENGEVDIALINSSSLVFFKKYHDKTTVSQTSFAANDIGNVFCSTVAGMVKSTPNKRIATKFLRFLLSNSVQQYITTATGEYPVIKEIITDQKFNNQIYLNNIHSEYNQKLPYDIKAVRQLLINRSFIKNTG
ncbi:extracellular solute-binding protein [Candidatus Liberibacter africanus]|uniref:Extracellular solute-binding protein n=1 Tax=Candidatus Liberibacter africanus PTSAPSY TaxID=1277257 RepID=A0A0G3I4Y4_LIBAF|nr:extracellular solute-binding protein [Candidatus Liberibacter africanus]AKK20340.1 extracellular solute-binding protein [Candidatus Liberibacter africanus PTSAPSY]QTP64088.1 extracellular solute-binding protein [Candidatus Liberibacter africanus]